MHHLWTVQIQIRTPRICEETGQRAARPELCSRNVVAADAGEASSQALETLDLAENTTAEVTNVVRGKAVHNVE